MEDSGAGIDLGSPGLDAVNACVVERQWTREESCMRALRFGEKFGWLELR